MADMELVIKIPNEIYQDIVKNRFLYDEDSEVVSHAIINGTVIPKGHGRLKDVDNIFNEGFPEADINAEYYENIKKYPLWRTDITGIQSILKNAPTIIEADKVKSEVCYDT